MNRGEGSAAGKIVELAVDARDALLDPQDGFGGRRPQAAGQAGFNGRQLPEKEGRAGFDLVLLRRAVFTGGRHLTMLQM